MERLAAAGQVCAPAAGVGVATGFQREQSLQSARNGIVGSARQVVCVGRKENEVGVSKRRSTLISAKIRKGRKTAETEYPWPEKFAAGSEAEGSLKFLSRFKPLPNKPKPVTLPFERPLVDLENKIDEVYSSELELLIYLFICLFDCSMILMSTGIHIPLNLHDSF